MFRTVLLTVALGLAACGAEPRDAPEPPAGAEPELVSVHWPVSQPDPEARICIDYLTGEEIQVDPEPLLSLRHVREARVEPGSVQPALYLTDEGAERLAALTEANIGRALAVVIDGRVMAQPVIRAAITGGQMDFVPMRDAAEAEAMVHRINAALADLDAPLPR